MENLRGVVERITYANEDTGYSVVKIKCKNYIDLVTVVGSMATINVGSVITLKGFWSHNAKYGRQFEAREWEEALPGACKPKRISFSIPNMMLAACRLLFLCITAFTT